MHKNAYYATYALATMTLGIAAGSLYQLQSGAGLVEEANLAAQNVRIKPQLPSLKLSLGLEKRQYRVNEPISFLATLRNDLPTDVAIYRLLMFGGNLLLNVTGPDGKAFNYGIYKAELGRPTSLREVVSLSPGYSYGVAGENQQISINRPGKYLIAVSYSDAGVGEAIKKLGLPGWEGQITSSAIEITVK